MPICAFTTRVLASSLLLAVPACATAGRARYDALRHDYAALAAADSARHVENETALNQPVLARGELIRAVLERNPSSEAARQAWRAALARYRQAGGSDGPMLELSAAPLSFASSDARIGYEVGISQRIALGGKRDAQAELAVAEAVAARGDFAATRLQLALHASRLYDDYALAVGSAAINEQHVALVRTLGQTALAAYEAGRGDAQDGLQADAELARLEYEALALNTRRDVAVAQLNALLHRDPGAALPDPAGVAGAVDAHDAASTEDGERPALASRPDLEAARARVDVEAARVSAAEAELYPDLTLSTSYNSMWDMPEHRWMAGVAIELPFERTRRHGAIDEARALQSVAAHDAERMLDDARAEVAVARLQLRDARAALELYEQRLAPLARTRVDVAQASYVSARGSFAQLIDAERNLRAVELETLAARTELSKRQAELEHASGQVPGLSDEEVRP